MLVKNSPRFVNLSLALLVPKNHSKTAAGHLLCHLQQRCQQLAVRPASALDSHRNPLAAHSKPRVLKIRQQLTRLHYDRLFELGLVIAPSPRWGAQLVVKLSRSPHELDVKLVATHFAG